MAGTPKKLWHVVDNQPKLKVLLQKLQDNGFNKSSLKSLLGKGDARDALKILRDPLNKMTIRQAITLCRAADYPVMGFFFNILKNNPDWTRMAKYCDSRINITRKNIEKQRARVRRQRSNGSSKEGPTWDDVISR